MYKRISISFLAASLLAQPIAYAHEVVGSSVLDGFSGFLSPDWSKDFSVTAGTKVWLNDWSLDRFLSSGFTTPTLSALAIDSAPDSLESDQEAVPIPQLSVRYKWLFATGSYYSKTDFEFDDLRSSIEAASPTARVRADALFQITGERYEWDAAGGIYVHPYVAILGGYKKVRQGVDSAVAIDLNVNGINSRQTANLFSDVDVEGPTIGIAASVPIQSGFGIYASYAHGFMDAELRDVNESLGAALAAQLRVNRDFRARDTDATYDVAEGGISYTYGTKALLPHMPLSAATAYAGYRYQHISTEFDEPVQDRSDVTRGFAVGVNLTF
ncbi:MAG: hypothetical protein ACREWG_02725 [Gammaproteobacteria bacterium]